MRRGNKYHAVDLALQCRAVGLPEPVREYGFALPLRRWRFDYAWPDVKIAVEQEGVVYPTKRGDHRLGGRHVSVKGFRRDCEKYGEAFAMGWRVLRVMPEQISSGAAISWLETAFSAVKSAGPSHVEGARRSLTTAPIGGR